MDVCIYIYMSVCVHLLSVPFFAKPIYVECKASVLGIIMLVWCGYLQLWVLGALNGIPPAPTRSPKSELQGSPF